MNQSMVKLLLVGVCLLSHSSTLADFDSAKIFPASAKFWLQISDVRAVRDLMSGGLGESMYQKIVKSAQWSTVLRNLNLNDHSTYNLTGLRMVELIELLEGEVALGLFDEGEAKRWCFFLDPKSEYVALEILRSNLEKQFEKRGCIRVENRIGDCSLYSWSKDEDCFLTYVIRNEKLLASNSPMMLAEMTKRWIEKGTDGLHADFEFASACRSTFALSQPGMNLFIRNQEIKLIRSFDDANDFSLSVVNNAYWVMLNALASLDVYGILPFFQSEVTSTFASLQFPDRSKGVELALKIQINTPDGDKLFEQPGRATFPENAPFAAFDAISYSVLNADFWTASDHLRRLSMDATMLKAHEENRQLARKHGIPETIFANKDSKHLLPVVFRCVRADGSSAIIFRFRNRDVSFDTYSKSRIPPRTGGFISTTRTASSDGVYHTEIINIPMEFPAELGLNTSKIAPKPKYYGIRGDYFIVCNSENYFRDLPLNPEDPLGESISYQMVKRKLDDQFSGKAFALDYWDLSPLLENAANSFENSTIGTLLGIVGAKTFDDLFRSMAEDLGPVGGAVSKNPNGFRLEYIMLTRR